MDDKLERIQIVKNKIREMCEELHLKFEHISLLLEPDEGDDIKLALVFEVTEESILTPEELEQLKTDKAFESLMKGLDPGEEAPKDILKEIKDFLNDEED